MEPRAVVDAARRLARPARRIGRDVARRQRARREPLYGLLDAAARSASTDDVWASIWDNRRRLVRSLAPGKSFLDLGGMFGVDGEMAFLAEEVGATRVALFDAMDPSENFAKEHSARGSRIQFFQGDLHDPSIVEELGQFDVVWCTGVVYHSPNPMQQLQHLRRMTTETLVLGSLVLPEVPGIEQACIFYPGMTSATKRTFAEVFGDVRRFPGMTSPFDETPLMAYVNMWWGISPSALRAMARLAGFETIEAAAFTPFSLDVVARVGGTPPAIYPPFDQSRERVRRRLSDLPGDEIPAYAEAQWHLMNEQPSAPSAL